MLKILKTQMDSYNYEEFICDYNNLILCKKNKALWKSAISSKKGTVPFLKGFFDDLATPLDYIGYRNSVLKNEKIEDIIIGRNKEQSNTEDIINSLKYHYTIETYIGFLVEAMLFYSLSKQFKDLYKNNHLDINKKTDILCNGIYFQIKNGSFINSTNIDKMIDTYKSFNAELQFIFYTIEEDNIYFLSICGNPYLHIDSIDGFTFCYKPTLLEYNDYMLLLYEHISADGF